MSKIGKTVIRMEGEDIPWETRGLTLDAELTDFVFKETAEGLTCEPKRGLGAFTFEAIEKEPLKVFVDNHGTLLATNWKNRVKIYFIDVRENE